MVDRALDLLIVKLERNRLGKAARPRPLSIGENGITRSVRRAVFERDGEQCTYRNKAGERCTARSLLELDHAHARSRGGAHDVENVRVLCAAHNHLRAEKDFGKGYVAEKMAERRAETASRKASVTSVVEGPRAETFDARTFVDERTGASCASTSERDSANAHAECAAHNRFRAEKDFGKGYVAEKMAERRAETASRKASKDASVPHPVTSVDEGPCAETFDARTFVDERTGA